MELLAEYGIFLLKSITVLMVIVLIILVIASQNKKSRTDGKLTIKHLNAHFKQITQQIQANTLDKHGLKAFLKTLKRQEKQEKKQAKQQNKQQKKNNGLDQDTTKPKAYVLEFKGDIKASQTEQLREEITALLSVADKQDEVVIKLDSAGGMVHGYGLAAAQLKRIREKAIPLTVCIDKVAASGGYLMAAVADQIIAAPFAVIGSIGVVAQIPNFHRFLKNKEIDVEVLTAGKYKRSLTIFGENTEAGRKKFIHDLEDTHGLFKDFVSENRAQLDIAQVADGDIWYGQKALDKKLVDKIQTSDDYIVALCQDREVYQINYQKKKSLAEKISHTGASIVNKSFIKMLDKLERLKY